VYTLGQETMLRPSLVLVALLGATACTPIRSFPPPAPTASQEWTAVLIQSGGFAGVNLEIRVSSEGTVSAADARSTRKVEGPLLESNLLTLNRLISETRIAALESRSPSCADCFLYDLVVTKQGSTWRWRGDDTTLADSGASELVGLLKALRDQALAAAY